jgi:hypothetical protein
LIAGIVVGAAAIVLAAYFFWPRPDPCETITQVRQAFTNRDVVAFRKYVDEDSAIGDAVDQLAAPLVAAIQGSQGSQNNGDSVLTNFAVQAMLAYLKPQLIRQGKVLIEEVVTAGALAPSDGQQAQGQNTQGILLSLLHVAFDSGATFSGSQVVSRAGQSAKVSVAAGIPAQQRTIAILVDMKMEQGVWRIVRIENLQQTLLQLGGQQ